MTTKEFGVCAATVMASKGMREYMKWYMKNVWKCRVIVVLMVIAAVLTIAVMATIKVEVRGATLNEQHIEEDVIEEERIVESYDRDLTTTAGHDVKIINGYFDSKVVSYDIQREVENVWLDLGECKRFRDGWKKNFQVEENRWVDPNGRLSSWEAIETEADNRRVNNYFGSLSINGKMLKMPEELDEKHDLYIIDMDLMQTGIVRLVNGSLEWLTYDENGILVKEENDNDEEHYNTMKQNWFE